MNPFELPIQWTAVATLFTGIAAVVGAFVVANRQIQLRKDEVRVALFDRRRDALGRFDLLSDDWWRNARLPQESEKELRGLVKDVELLFNHKVHAEAEALFKDTIFQNMFERHTTMFSDAGNMEQWQKALDGGQERFKQIAERLPKLRQLLVDATRVGTIFPG